MTFAKALNWVSLAIAVGAVGAWFLDFSVLWGAGLGVVGLVWCYYKMNRESKGNDESSGLIDASDVLDIFDGD